MMCKPAIALLLPALLTAAPPAAPKPPAEYNVLVRYQIDAFRTEHVRQFDEMTAALAKVGFRKVSEFEDERENRAIDRMVGVIASGSARKLLDQRHVRALLLIPLGAKLFDDPDKPNPDQPLRVQIELYSGLDAGPQRRLAEQVRGVLAELGFREAVGYDHRGHTRLVGMTAVGRLDTLLNDLRRHPAGAKLPPPFPMVTPIRVIEVMPGLEPTADRPAPAAVPRELENVGPELRALLENKEEAGKVARLEVLLAYTPSETDRAWQRSLREAVPTLLIDGRLGPLISVRCTSEQAVALAALPIVSFVRLPQTARPQEQAPPVGADLREALRASGLERLHELGHRGRGIRVAVVDGDFRGWREQLGKGLPEGTTLLDLTAARNRDLLPDPSVDDPKAVGHGTRCALLLMRAAPEADLVLIRIDPAAPYQLQEAARAINGEVLRSESLDTRGDELEQDRTRLDEQRAALLEERRLILGSAAEFDEVKKRWDAYKKKQDEFDQEEKAYEGRIRRYLDLRRALRGLRGIAVAACPLVWNAGHPVDGSSALSRYFDDRPFKAAIWFQSAGNTRGQAWSGLFRDTDGNGAMEFTAPLTLPSPPAAGGEGRVRGKLPDGRWTNELNFLAWHPAEGGRGPVADIPAKSRLRVSIQWREAHDPEYLKNGTDAYRAPTAEVRLLVLRQRDPLGEKLPADDLEVVAQSVGLPARLGSEPGAAVYEQAVEFTAEAGGRYAVRIEGRAPEGIQPRGAPTVLAAHRAGEFRPRVFVETLSGPGRAVFADFTTDRPGQLGEGASLGMPADAHRVITVGAAARDGQPASSSAAGPPFGQELLVKPDVLAYDPLGTDGTSLAASFAAGLAAAALSAGAPQGKFLEAMRVQPGGVLRIPGDWPAPRR